MSQTLTPQKKIGLLAGAVALIVVVVAIRAMPRSKQPKVREVEGVITFLDPASRRASMELKDPDSGLSMEISGIVPETCVIEISGAPAALGDLAVRDQVRVHGRIEKFVREDGVKDKRFVAERIVVTRRS